RPVTGGSRVGAAWGLRQALGDPAVVLRSEEGDRLAVGEPRQRDRQGAKGGADTGPNPTDRAKSSTKRHVLTDAKGIPLGLVLSGANVHDKWMALPPSMTRSAMRSALRSGRRTAAW